MGFFALALLLAVVLGGEILLYRKFSLSHLEYHCALDREEATEGDVVELVETIKNRKWLPEPWLKSEITTSKWLDFAGAQSIVTDKTRFVPSFFVVRSFQKVQRSWHVTCLKRGDFAIQKVGLVASDLFGTVNVSRAAEVDSRILVLRRAWIWMRLSSRRGIFPVMSWCAAAVGRSVLSGGGARIHRT